jgi:hypothetical protein
MNVDLMELLNWASESQAVSKLFSGEKYEAHRLKPGYADGIREDATRKRTNPTDDRRDAGRLRAGMVLGAAGAPEAAAPLMAY